jgi:hypothetical protein
MVISRKCREITGRSRTTLERIFTVKLTLGGIFV